MNSASWEPLPGTQQKIISGVKEKMGKIKENNGEKKGMEKKS